MVYPEVEFFIAPMLSGLPQIDNRGGRIRQNDEQPKVQGGKIKPN
jgi:hypothetical protein